MLNVDLILQLAITEGVGALDDTASGNHSTQAAVCISCRLVEEDLRKD